MRDFRWDIIQQTQPWYDIKVAKVSSTKASLFLVNGRNDTGLGKGALKLAKDIATEIITGDPASVLKKFSGNASTRRGNAYEPKARKEYQYRTFNKVHEVGFVQLGNLLGCSTDGIILKVPDHGKLKNGIIEIKCYEGAHYLEMLEKGIEQEIKGVEAQIQYSLMVTGFDFCDFVLYHPKFPEKTKLIIKRVYRNEKTIMKFRKKLFAFKREVNRMLELAGYHKRVYFFDYKEQAKEIETNFNNAKKSGVMSNRLDQEREKKLQPQRMVTAIAKIKLKGYDPIQVDETKLTFLHCGKKVTYFPYSGWATGSTIKDGRGLKKLLRQI